MAIPALGGNTGLSITGNVLLVHYELRQCTIFSGLPDTGSANDYQAVKNALTTYFSAQKHVDF